MGSLDTLQAGGSAALLAAQAAAPTLPTGAMARTASADPMAAAKKAAQDFESFFVTSMLESMMAGLKPDKMFGGGQGESLYRSMLNQEYGKAIAARDPLGLSEIVTKEILQMQEKASKARGGIA